MESPFVGRQPELARLASLGSTAADGTGGALVLIGPPGIGKSSLLDRLAELQRADGRRILRTRGVEAETELPFSALHALLRPIIDKGHAIPAVQREALD